MVLDTVSSQGPLDFVYEQNRFQLGEIDVIKERPRESPGSEISYFSGDPRDDWVISIKSKLEQAHKDDDMTSWGKLCIYRIPHYLHQKHPTSYMPETVSLGPYHHGREALRPMEYHKWRAVSKMVKRSKQPIETYIDAMSALEETARACYQGPIGFSSNEFAEMLVLDGCFILEIFRGCIEGFQSMGYDRNDPVFANRPVMHSIQRDMIILENQLPLCVLNQLLAIQLGSRDQTGVVEQLAVRFFHPLMHTDLESTKIEKLQEKYKFLNLQGGKDELHCLNVFYESLLTVGAATIPRFTRWYAVSTSSVVDKRPKKMICPAAELRDGGIKFRRRITDQFCDIQFTKGCIEIPRLFIHEGTKSLFLNLIAFEQCHVYSCDDIASYIFFMDNLIDSPEDVSHLRSCGIIVNWLENDYEVAEMFNRLGENLVFKNQDSYICSLSRDITSYYRHRNKFYRKWNTWKSTLKEKYFDSPWAYISFVAAFILLLLTFSQSYFAAYAYYKPPS